MIVTGIVTGLLAFILFLVSALPLATSLPYGVDGALWTVGNWVSQLLDFLWPLQIVFTIFFYVYIPVLVILMLMRFILGHRAPGRDRS